MLSAIIVAAGSSQRMGFDKLFADLGGRPVVAWSLSAFEQCAEVDEMVIVAKPEKEPTLRALAQTWGWTKLRAIVPGGEQRHHSVWNGLQGLSTTPGQERFVAVQDGARPLVTPGMIARCLDAARAHGAACCAAPVSDTLKRVDADGRICASVDRANVWAMQTPQIFRLADLRHAYQSVLDSGLAVTDEASALERLQQPVTLVNSGDFNWKITFPADLDLARHLLALRSGGK
jgi:2-C-methyl-D-erythritol 4-phosphate cytidylyltransferase